MTLDVLAGGHAGSLSPALLAHSYRARGWVPFPLRPRGKTPLGPWRIFQTTRPSHQSITLWWGLFHQDANVGLVTGAISGLVVLDLDLAKNPDAAQAVADRCGGVLPAAPMVRTGSGGLHLFFAHPAGVVRNRVGLLPGVDLRGDGGYVCAPPSIHACGQPYEWLADMAMLPPLPSWLISEINTPRAPAPNVPRGAPGVAKFDEGRRNYELFRRACAMRGQGHDRHWIEEELVAINQAACVPPLPPAEVASIAASAARYPPGQ